MFIILNLIWQALDVLEYRILWSLGVITYAMTVGYLPFEDPDTNKLYKKILNLDYLIPGYVDKSCKDLIKSIL